METFSLGVICQAWYDRLCAMSWSVSQRERDEATRFRQAFMAEASRMGWRGSLVKRNYATRPWVPSED